MHETALQDALIFRQTYLKNLERTALDILDVGGQDVNGSMRPCMENPLWTYTSVDMTKGKGVDIVVKEPHEQTPFPGAPYDVIVSSSCFEHDPCFWLTLSRMHMSLKQDGGLIYLNVPSVGPYHTYPVDNWRFYADAGPSLAWGQYYQKRWMYCASARIRGAKCKWRNNSIVLRTCDERTAKAVHDLGLIPLKEYMPKLERTLKLLKREKQAGRVSGSGGGGDEVEMSS